MTKWTKVVALSTLALFCTVAAVSAQEQTGAIEGVVTDTEGKALPGVNIEAKGPAGTLVAVTDANGKYRLPRVMTGSYVITSTLEGFVTTESQPVRVSLGQTAAVTFQLQSTTVISETVTVSGEMTGIDVSSSSTSASITNEDIQYLPKGRDFTALATMAPGASQETFAGGLSIDGASGSENRFVIDGIESTNPLYGTSGQALITDFVEEVQVKSAGYQAEYGGSVGGVVSAVTKSGSNDFGGAVGLYYGDRSWDGKERTTPYRTSDTSLYRTFDEEGIKRSEPFFSLGGRIVQDKAWFYAGYSYSENETERTPTGQPTVSSTNKTEYYLANLSGNVGSKFLYKVSGNWAENTIDNLLPAKDGTTALTTNLNIDTESPTFSYSGYADYIPNANFYLSGRVGFYSADTATLGDVPDSRIFFRDAPFPIAGDSRFRSAGFATTPGITLTDFDLFERTAGSLDGNIFFEAFGSHALKAGVQYEKVENEVASGEPYNLFEIRWGLPDRFGAGVQGTFGSLHVRRFGSFGGAASKNTGFFLQDSWAIRPNLTLNVGVRADNEEVPNYGHAAQPSLAKNAWEFDYGDKVAPRLGFAWDVMSDQKLKVYSSWGSYYDITKLNIRGSFGGERWIAFLYPLNTLDWESLPSGCQPSTNDASNNPCPALGDPAQTLDLRFPADPADPLFGVDPSLEPFQQDEFQIGADYQATPNTILGFRYVEKSVKHAIEDIGFFACATPTDCFEGYNIGNPGEGLNAIDVPGPAPGNPKAKRDYTAVELSASRRFVGNWQARVGYTYSELEGNYPGLASSDEFGRTSPNTNRLFDYQHNSFDRNGRPVYGKLNTDRPHQVDAQFVYRFNWGTSIGVNQYYGSGTPVSTQIRYAGVPFFAFGRKDAGRTDDFTQTDLLVAHVFEIGDFSFEASLNVINLLDEDTTTLLDPTSNLGDLCTSTPGCDRSQDFFFGAVPYDVNGSLNPASANPYYLKPNIAEVFTGSPFQTRRTLRLGLKFQF